jgi:bifunctional non-homologous end joining protein LigD
MSKVLDILDDEERDALRKAGQPKSLQPMLAVLTDERFSDADWIYERKLDGERALAFRRGRRVRLMIRNDQDVGDTYPELVEAIARQSCDDFVADGEIVAFKNGVTSFSRLQGRMQVSDPDEARASSIAVYYYLFDLPYLEGHRLDALPLRSRKRLLKRALDYSGPLRYTAHRNGIGEAYFTAACDKGWEGVIAKRADSTYRHGRSSDWLKFKCGHGQELVIGGFTEPHGSRTGFGALLVGYYQGDSLRYAGKVGTGYDEVFLEEFRGRLDRLERKTSPFDDEVHESGVHWVRPRYVGEFRFTEWTDADKLRHPTFLGLRRDKEAREVVREQAR